LNPQPFDAELSLLTIRPDCCPNTNLLLQTDKALKMPKCNYLLWRVSKMFGCRSLEIFWKKQNFRTREIFVKKFRIKLGNLSSEKVRKVRKQGFPNVRKFQKLFYSEISKNYKKMKINSNFRNREKLVPTQKLTRKFG